MNAVTVVPLAHQGGSAVRVLPTPIAYHGESEQHHGEEGYRFHRREDRADSQPDLGRTYPEEVVTGTEDTGD